uniref:Uncharacterized protein n=1 Tax=Anguilla anguilla TaxID=7936 RepID=A0A0E9PLB3_ANGAN
MSFSVPHALSKPLCCVHVLSIAVL